MGTYILRGEQRRQIARSRLFNIDNGAGATVDDVVLCHSQRVRLLAARIVYTTENAGTVAGATIRIGTVVAGTQIAGSTAYTNAATVGGATPVALAQTDIPANTPVIVRHTGIAATAAGEAYVEIEYEVAA